MGLGTPGHWIHQMTPRGFFQLKWAETFLLKLRSDCSCTNVTHSYVKETVFRVLIAEMESNIQNDVFIVVKSPETNTCFVIVGLEWALYSCRGSGSSSIASHVAPLCFYIAQNKHKSVSREGPLRFPHFKLSPQGRLRRGALWCFQSTNSRQDTPKSYTLKLKNFSQTISFI